jgi:hypothetical protein
VVYRSEKKKILYSNIDLCNYIIKVLQGIKERPKMSMREFISLTMEKTALEQEEGLLKRWVHNADPIFSEED